MRNERGIALVFVLFLLTTVSALAVSLTFLANSETYASGNYRLATQGRYGAESGMQKISNFLVDPGQYNPSTVAPGGLVDATVSPVKWNGKDVILDSDIANSNYPDAAVAQAFANASIGDLVAGNTKMHFTGQAKLLTEDAFFDRFNGTNAVAQTWEITASSSTQNNVRSATVEVSGMIETRKYPVLNYGAFGVDPGCDSMFFKGNINTDSYNSADIHGSTAPTTQNNGGDVGTNGNLDIEGSVSVHGDLYSPKGGVGACDAANGNITALTTQGKATVYGQNSDPSNKKNWNKPKKLPKVITFPTPAAPAPSTAQPVDLSGGLAANTCLTAFSLTAPQCTVSVDLKTLTLTNTGAAPLTLPSVTLGSQVNLVLNGTSDPGTSHDYVFNSLTLTGQATVQAAVTSPTDTVVVKITGLNPDGTEMSQPPLDTTGGSYIAPNISACAATCSQFSAQFLEFIYGGTGQIKMEGNSSAAVVVYAPKASLDFGGTADLYGAVIADKIVGHGTFNIHYDQNLQGNAWSLSDPMLTAFSWKNKNN
jgi:hypothetical protein